MNVLLLALAVVVPSVGEVKLDCKEPGPWMFEMKAGKAPDGVDTVRVSLRTEKEAPPPTFAVKWFVSQKGVHHVWTGESTHYGIPWTQPMVSELTSYQPVYALLNANDRNRFTFACSESVRRAVFRSPISEAGMGFNCSFSFSTGRMPRRLFSTCRARRRRSRFVIRSARRSPTRRLSRASTAYPCPSRAL